MVVQMFFIHVFFDFEYIFWLNIYIYFGKKFEYIYFGKRFDVDHAICLT